MRVTERLAAVLFVCCLLPSFSQALPPSFPKPAPSLFLRLLFFPLASRQLSFLPEPQAMVLQAGNNTGVLFALGFLLFLHL